MDGYMTNLKQVAVIGSGVIGRNWAILFARAGLNVNIYDVLQSQTEIALQEVNEKLAQYSNIKPGIVKEFNCLGDCLLNVQYVQECVPESIEIKKQIFNQINEILSQKPSQNDLVSSQPSYSYHEKPVSGKSTLNNQIVSQSCRSITDEKDVGCSEPLPKKVEYLDDGDEHLYDRLYENFIILASSSSGIPCSQFTQNLRIRSRCIIAHPLNPPLFCPLVEIVPASFTIGWVTQNTYLLMEKIGQKPIVLRKEVQGFAVNRIQYALLAECWRLVQDGVLTASDVDKVMTDGLGLRYAFFGPFHNCHLNADGIEDYMRLYGAGIQSVISSFGPNPKFEGETLQKIKLCMEASVPLDLVKEGRKKREKCLEKISKLKSELRL